MPEKHFLAINSALQDIKGKDFSEIVQHNPNVAYKILRTLITECVITPDTVAFNDLIAASSNEDGQLATTGMAKKLASEIMPDSDFEAAHVVLSVLGKQRFRDTIRQRPSPPIRRFDFYVEPPNLAS